MATIRRDMRIGIVGTGFSGLCIAINLKKRGHENFILLEKADSIGGTWRENTYPGAECDIPSALYSFSFERNPRWTHKWSEQEEILSYMNHCTDKYGVRDHIRFNKTVLSAKFNEAKGTWRVRTDDGEDFTFDALVSGVGQLHRINMPEIKGQDAFSGPQFHSAQWDHNVDLTDKNVCVIGNAASAIQFIPQIAPKVKKLTIFQRSANWMVPKNDREYSGFEKWLGTVFPPSTALYRFGIWFRGEGILYWIMSKNSRLREKLQQQCIDYISEKISDPELRQKLIPDYPIGAKRILFSDDYYDALARTNVDVAVDGIAEISSSGIHTVSGNDVAADTIIYSTGFETSSFLTPMEVTGLDDQSLNEKWREEGAEAYLGITHTGFPNFYLMYGPNTNLGHNSIILMIESQTSYILSALEALSKRKARWADVTPQAHKKYNEWLQQRMKDKIWASVEKSWYKTGEKVTNNWVGSTQEYWWRTRKFDPQNYRFAE